MNTTYRPGIGHRLMNIPFKWLAGRGLGADYRYVLTVPGRITGHAMSTPVDVMTSGERRYLVSGYGEANWVKNARTAGQVELARGGRTERLAVRELEAAAAAPILRLYAERVPVMRGQFVARHGDPGDAFLAEVPQHPVFELMGLSA
jgi:deazaflavin-dependent oxidoreductase (nitroreductase family)